MRLNAPSILTIFIAMLLGSASLAMKLGATFVPVYLPSQEYWLAIGGFLVLLVGSLVKGL